MLHMDQVPLLCNLTRLPRIRDRDALDYGDRSTRAVWVVNEGRLGGRTTKF